MEILQNSAHNPNKVRPSLTAYIVVDGSKRDLAGRDSQVIQYCNQWGLHPISVDSQSSRSNCLLEKNIFGDLHPKLMP